ncbi:hypothetical protein PoB_000344600 [Plakobranchus ocellatus]|uniref:Uncharacterized protein n=1 Tax=Plakobranchus ocellatus TaxID=259542 RepID=A0AAV3XIZ2_9GAST|nr:hypothetical protein PoB_000344600 [Plakobranchus ocellatus]
MESQRRIQEKKIQDSIPITLKLLEMSILQATHLAAGQTDTPHRAHLATRLAAGQTDTPYHDTSGYTSRCRTDVYTSP